jgi:hypothetical protein
MADIGVFDESHLESHGREILQSGSLKRPSKGEIEYIVNQLNGNPNAEFILIPSLPHITKEIL